MADSINWWLWSAWIVDTDSSRHHFYGFLAPTRAPLALHTLSEIELPSKSVLRISEVVVCKAEIEFLESGLAAKSGRIDLSHFFSDAPVIDLDAYRQIRCRAFGHAAAGATCASALSGAALTALPAEDVEISVDCCEKELGLPFRTTHATHIGGFDLFHLHDWLDGPAPYGSEIVHRGNGNSTKSIRIWRSEFVGRRQIIHLIVSADGEIIHEAGHFFDIGHRSVEVAMACDIGSYEFSIMDCDFGALRHKDSVVFVKQIDLSSHVNVRRVLHRDRLRERAERRGGASGQRAASTKCFATKR